MPFTYIKDESMYVSICLTISIIMWSKSTLISKIQCQVQWPHNTECISVCSSLHLKVGHLYTAYLCIAYLVLKLWNTIDLVKLHIKITNNVVEKFYGKCTVV